MIYIRDKVILALRKEFFFIEDFVITRVIKEIISISFLIYKDEIFFKIL